MKIIAVAGALSLGLGPWLWLWLGLGLAGAVALAVAKVVAVAAAVAMAVAVAVAAAAVLAAAVAVVALLKSETFQAWCWPKVVGVHRIFTILSYPIPFLLQACIYWAPTKENAKNFRVLILSLWVPCSTAFYVASYQGCIASSWQTALFKHFLWFYAVDIPMSICLLAALTLGEMFERKTTNRLLGESPDFRGKRIVVLGNGPSLVKGNTLGALIDGMDEVVRFNNFQTKTSGLEAWTGTKTTVHFSDSMLFPSYPEYNVPNATVVLSLFMDRLMVAGSYLIFRTGIDLAFRESFQMLRDPALGWIPHEDICNLKAELGISHWKHPTSGCLAIDWFVRHRPDPSVPVYIHGFDFFEGPEIHYYNKTEPLYERLNDLLGVTTMHQPEKEKAYVARLVAEGKVRWLKDATPEGKLGIVGGA